MSFSRTNFVVPTDLKTKSLLGQLEIYHRNYQGNTYSICQSTNNSDKIAEIPETIRDYYQYFLGKTEISHKFYAFILSTKLETKNNTPYNIYSYLTGFRKSVRFQLVSHSDSYKAKFEKQNAISISVGIIPTTKNELSDMSQQFATRYYFDFIVVV